MNKEIVEVSCANQACNRVILFVKDDAIPKKTYCDYCCGEMSTPPNEVGIDTRIAPRSYPNDKNRGDK